MKRIELDNLHRPAALARFLLTAGLGFYLDMFSKVWAAAHLKNMADPDGVRLIPGWLHLKYTENHGAVFGIGQGWSWLFVVVSIAAVVFLVYLFASSGRQWFYQIVLGMLLAGVLGNLYDRMVFGYVRDMIYMLQSLGVFPWIFNVADALLCCGVGLMILHMLFSHRDGQTAEAEPEAA